MNRTLKIVLISIGATFVCAYLVTSLLFFHDPKQDMVCCQLEINIMDSTRRQFISSADIRLQLRQKGLLPENKPYDEINTQLLEDAISMLEVVQKVECCKMNSGTIRLNVSQREPRLRVIGAENYYVDSNRNIMKASHKTACHVPVVTGYVTHEMAQGELFDFVCWLDKHNFWDEQIEQINILPNKEIELVPKVGGHIILLGHIANYEEKLSKLKVFYDDCLNKIGWQPYKEVDLRYNGQVVCR